MRCQLCGSKMVSEFGCWKCSREDCSYSRCDG